MTSANKHWNTEEVEILKKNYPEMRIENLCEMLGRTWQSIGGKAKRLGIKRNIMFSYESMGSLDLLLQETCESFYWIGFILADGHLRKPCGFSMNLASKDVNHLEKIAKFLKYKKELREVSEKPYGLYAMSFSDPDNFFDCVDKFSICSRKAYMPPNISEYEFNDDLLFSLIVGFIDGDGWIKYKSKEGCQLGIVSHEKWKQNLEFIGDFLYKFCEFSEDREKPNISTNKRKCTLIISNLYNVIKMKKKALDLGLGKCFLKRKWNKIDVNHENPRTKLANERRITAFKMDSEGCNIYEIAKRLGVSVSGAYGILRKAKKTAVFC